VIAAKKAGFFFHRADWTHRESTMKQPVRASEKTSKYSDQKQGFSRSVAEAQGNHQTGDGLFIIFRFKKSN
jgi:hypothetical protein